MSVVAWIMVMFSDGVNITTGSEFKTIKSLREGGSCYQEKC